MIPQLIAIAGPMKGIVFELTEDEMFVGRDQTNHLFLRDKSVSRQHCLIVRENEDFKVLDLESRNGIFINDVPTREHAIKHGDIIRVGNSFLLFLASEENVAPTSNNVQLDSGTLITISATRFRLEDALYLIARDLNVLMKISAKINAVRSLAALQRQLLDAIFEIVPAERGAILLVGDSLEDTVSVFGLDKLSGPQHPMRVSRTVAQQVLKEGVALMSNEVVESNQLKSESLIHSRVTSLLCVPLMLLNKIIGIIYLDASKTEASFNEGHLQMVTAIAGLASGALDSARHMEWLESENRRLNANLQTEHNMVGESPRMRDVYQFVAKVAPTDSTILIRGESGTGKELAAHAIHRNSPRAGKPFVALNCAALTETLLESELFGHEKGAFTGAIAQKKGRLEIAAGGTVLLDEVGEMSFSIQSKLLRVLQEREFERVGGTRPIKLDIRVIAATNRELEEAISDGRFRKDLYYRLNVVSLTMPPLRARPEDIALLASYFIAKYSDKCKRRVTGISDGARACLLSYDWPGNVRELENAIERAVVLGSTERIQLEDLPETMIEAAPSVNNSVTSFHEAVKEAKKQLVSKALENAGGNYSEAARSLGIHPNNLHRLVRHLHLKPH